MCGIFGVVAKGLLSNSELNFCYQSMVTGVVRGTDGFGLMAVDRDFKEVRAIKVAGVPQNVFGKTAFRDFTGWMDKNAAILVGHHRSATKGTVNDQNAHPFHYGGVTMVHNGTLTSGVDLTKFKVDSEGICAAISEKGAEAFSTLHGAYACVWYDQKDGLIHLFKNDERPLTVLKFRNSIFFASEYGMLDWLLRRVHHGVNEKDITLYTIEKDREYMIGKDCVVRQANEPIKKTWPASTYQPYGRHGGMPTTKFEKKEARRLKRERAKGNDLGASFFLFTEVAIANDKGETTFRYIGFTDRNEAVYVNSPVKLDFGWANAQWEGLLIPGVKYGVLPELDKTTPCYEVDYESLVTEDDWVYNNEETIYPYGNNPGIYTYTLNNKVISSYNELTVLAKGCACCEAIIEPKDINNCMGLTMPHGTSVSQLICPVCSNETITVK